MKITTLVENTTSSKEYGVKHGLSIHIKTEKHNILFDLGPNDLFAENAKKLNIDISEVDTVIISHGHKDHGGGLEYFLKLNDKAQIYINRNAFDEHYTGVLGIFKYNIGLDNKLRDNNRIILVDDFYKIDEELVLFSSIKTNKFLSKSNENLYMKKGNSYIKDDFKHEQNLIVTSKGTRFLFAGCAHRGIVNILEQAENIIHSDIDYAIGGFHLYNPVSHKAESKELINNIGDYLKTKKTIFYTCHCTGENVYKQLKGILGVKINYLSTGIIEEYS